MIYGLKRIAEDGLGLACCPCRSPPASRSASLSCAAATAGRSADRPAPLPPVRPSARALAANTLGFFVIFGISSSSPSTCNWCSDSRRWRQGSGRCRDAARSSSAPLLTPLLVRLVQPAFAMAGGLVVAAVGFGLLTQVDGDSALAMLVSGSVVLRSDLAPVFTLATDLMVGAPHHRSAPARPRRSRRQAPSSVARSASRPSAPSARPSTATRLKVHSQRVLQTRRPRPRVTRSAGR